MNTINLKIDKFGMIASILCMVHCIATPFLFLAKSCSVSCCESSPSWWKSLDFFFLLISLYAIYHSSKNSSKSWIKYAMWISWTLLLMIILNENLKLLSLTEYLIYLPAIMLVALHLYNLKYCKCKTDGCCVN